MESRAPRCIGNDANAKTRGPCNIDLPGLAPSSDVSSTLLNHHRARTYQVHMLCQGEVGDYLTHLIALLLKSSRFSPQQRRSTWFPMLAE
jgi:hypothetical protein